ncbi:hypothetical protein [Halocatena pleomorpha]|uniref:Uncharacterized protein n=1 Tax=Halocatena pleomorpha TaxID=1785090 RepID=A0A3P3R2W6_9EURY|nr:hypothetical protein [Halocatena pleomorpha]RRJ27821.1 hypothetical protein EIK79_17210 [Halocatena pleomorpha]
MIRIELDRIHLELLLLAALIAAFAGAVFEPTVRYGVNVVPLVALVVVGMIGLIVLIHRRFTAGDRNRVRGMVWLALLGALLGATVSSVVVGTARSMALAAAGVGAMFFALGTQFSIVIKSREAAARDALTEILDEENVFVASEQARANGTTDDRQTDFESTTESTRVSRTVSSAFRDNGSESDGTETSRSESRRDDDDDNDGDDVETDEQEVKADETDEATESDDEQTDESEDERDIEQTDDPGSEHWAQSTAEDSGPIPVIRSIASTESSEE